MLLQIEKSMLRHTHPKFHFRRTTFSKGEKKKAIANKNDYRTGGFTKLEQGTDWDQAQTVSKLGCVLGPVPARPPDSPAPPRAEPSPPSSPDSLQGPSTAHGPQSSHPNHTPHLASDHMENTRNIETTAISSKPLPPSWQGLGCFQIW